MVNLCFITFLYYLSLLPEVYEIEMENTELSGDPDSQQQHFFEIGNSHSNSSGITTDLIQRLYMLFSSGELMMQDKKEAHSEEITSPANDRQDEKGNLEC